MARRDREEADRKQRKKAEEARDKALKQKKKDLDAAYDLIKDWTTEDRQKTLEEVLRKTLHDKGITIIPAFSLGRTQSILYEMNGIFERVQASEGRTLMRRIDVIVDSPLASRYTQLYEGMREYWSREAQHLLRTDDQPLVFENLTTVGSHNLPKTPFKKTFATRLWL